jgi:hypothetical protein
LRGIVAPERFWNYQLPFQDPRVNKEGNSNVDNAPVNHVQGRIQWVPQESDFMRIKSFAPFPNQGGEQY